MKHLRSPNLQNIVVYGLATGLAAALTLVLTRVLWRELTPADFGLWALVDPTLLPIATLVLFGVDHSIVKQLHADGLSLRVVTGTLLVSTVPATSLSLVAVGLVARFVFHLGWTDALLLTMAGEALILFMTSAFRATGAVYGYAAVLLSRNLLYLAALLVAAAADAPSQISVGLVFLVRGVCVLLVSFFAIAVLRPVPQWHWGRYRDAVVYGFPLLLTTFIFALSDMTDRWFLAEFTGIVAVGVYALHLKVAAILSQAIVLPFGLWFQPERFKRLDDPDGGRRFYIQTSVVLALICGYLSGGVWLARDLLLSLIAPGVLVSPLVLACCLGAVICLALSQALNVGLLLPGHTGKNAICTGFAVVAGVAACAVLVPLFGMEGAATGRLLGGFVLVGATAAWSRRIFDVAFPFTALALFFAVSAAIMIGLDGISAGRGLPALVLALVAWSAAMAGAAAIFWTRLRIPTQVARSET